MTSCLTMAPLITMVRLSIRAIAAAIFVFDLLFWQDISVKQNRKNIPKTSTNYPKKKTKKKTPKHAQIKQKKKKKKKKNLLLNMSEIV
jgi:hypothetical protein